jgi:hypothetical protein
LKVNEKLPPGFTVPESQSPVSEVDVWGMLVVTFVQVTVVPTGIVIGSGTKRNCWVIETACVLAGLAKALVDPRRPAMAIARTTSVAKAAATMGRDSRISPTPIWFSPMRVRGVVRAVDRRGVARGPAEHVPLAALASAASESQIYTSRRYSEN